MSHLKKSVVLIICASGSGTTTLGKNISQAFGYAHFDTDDYFWLPTNPPFTTSRPVEQRKTLLEADICSHQNCVISGSLCGWGDFIISLLDLLVLLDTPTEVRTKRIEQRELQRFGDRILPGGDMFANHQEFVEWAKTYDTAGPESRSRAMHEQWMKKLSCPVLTLDGTASASQLLQFVGDKLDG